MILSYNTEMYYLVKQSHQNSREYRFLTISTNKDCPNWMIDIDIKLTGAKKTQVGKKLKIPSFRNFNYGYINISNN